MCKKGSRNQEELEREHSKEFKLMQKFRAGCEGSISVLKRAFGLRRCLFKGFKGFARAIGSIVIFSDNRSTFREMFYHDEFLEIEKNNENFSYYVALSEPLPEDNWKGPVGFIHQVVYDLYLKNHEERSDRNRVLPLRSSNDVGRSE